MTLTRARLGALTAPLAHPFWVFLQSPPFAFHGSNNFPQKLAGFPRTLPLRTAPIRQTMTFPVKTASDYGRFSNPVRPSVGKHGKAFTCPFRKTRTDVEFLFHNSLDSFFLLLFSFVLILRRPHISIL